MSEESKINKMWPIYGSSRFRKCDPVDDAVDYYADEDDNNNNNDKRVSIPLNSGRWDEKKTTLSTLYLIFNNTIQKILRLR